MADTQYFRLGLELPKTPDHSDLQARRPTANKPYVKISALETIKGGSSDTPPPSLAVGNAQNATPQIGPPVPSGLAIPKFVVSLPMPTNIPTEYSAEWMQDSTSLTERGISALAEKIGISGDTIDESLSFKTGVSVALNQLAGIAKSTAFRKLSQQKGFAYNPHKELFYQGPIFRSMSLSWSLAFKNKKEYDDYEKCLENLAFYMHPEYYDGASSGVWQIPETFKIDFVDAKVRKFGNCVLTNIQATPTASGQWRSHTQGEPAHVELSLSFLELEPLTKSKIREGF